MNKELKELIDALERGIRKAFLAAIADVVNSVIERQLIEYIKQQNIVAAFETLGLSPAAMRPITALIEQTYERGGIYAVSQMPKYIQTPAGKAVPRFDIRNERAEAYIRQHSATLIQDISDDVSVNVRNTLTSGLERGDNPVRTAKDIIGRIDPATGKRTGGIIGLTVNQEGWVQSYRNKLENLNDAANDMELRDKKFDSIVTKAIADGKPLDQATIDKLVMRYRNNALNYRGKVIARTETMQSLNASDYDATAQMIAKGAIRARDVVNEWDTAGDDRVRHTHRSIDGQRRAFGEPFEITDGLLTYRLMYPGDSSLGAPASQVIQCRCRLRKRIDWLTDLD